MRCFSEITRPAWRGQGPGGLIVVMTQCRNLGLIDEVQCSTREECQLYREKIIHQLAYFHNVIIDSKYRNPHNPVINILAEGVEGKNPQ